MTKEGTYRDVVIILTVCLVTLPAQGNAYVQKYLTHSMCNRSIIFEEYESYAAKLMFTFGLNNDYDRCWTEIHIPADFHVAYRFENSLSFNNRCDTRLSISEVVRGDARRNVYPFCNTSSFPTKDVLFDDQRMKTLRLDFQNVDNSGRYTLLVYMFLPSLFPCDSFSVRCLNGRCLHRDLFCDNEYNFCGDETQVGACSGYDRPGVGGGDLPINKINVIAPICLGLFIFLTLIFVVYFCCKNPTLRRLWGLSPQSNRRSRPPLTARDVYVINISDVGGTPEEGYDYVMDYKKFSAPPEYSSLENIAEASVRYTVNNSTNSENTGASNDSPDGATGSGNVNMGFSQDGEDVLPAYEQVMTNAENYNVNHNHL